MICGVLGPKGTFSEAVASLYWKNNIEIKRAVSIPELFCGLVRGEYENILVPLENTYAGTIDATLQSLLKYPVSIKGEITVPIRHNLVANRECGLDDLELLISQAVVLMQCGVFLEESLAGIRTQLASSSAQAFCIAREEKKAAAAIGSIGAARMYGLTIIKEKIENAFNKTCFIHLGRNKEINYSGDKCSLVFNLPDEPGSLYKALGVFNQAGLNLARIDSRRIPGKEAYSFFIEAELKGKESMSDIMEELKKYCLDINFLGAYHQKTEELPC